MAQSRGADSSVWRRVAAIPRNAGVAVAGRVRSNGASLLLAAAAAGIAFLAAGLIVGPTDAIFAPIAAVVAIGLSAGERVQRALEISGGVVLGVMAADLLSRVFGVGPLQVAAAVLLAMTAAVAVRPSGLMANQAAVAAVVVVALVPHLDTGPWVRFVDALVGGAVAVALNAVISPDPHRAARTITTHALGDYSAGLRRLGEAVRASDLAEAEAALADMDALDGAQRDVRSALAATRQRVKIVRSGRHERRRSLRAIEGVADRFVILLSTGRGLCRAGANVVRHGAPSRETHEADQSGVRSTLADALDELRAAVEQLREWVAGEGDPDSARELALRAAALASGAQLRTQATAKLAGEIRSAAVDVLRITGLDQAAAVALLERAAGRADRGEL